MSGAGELLEEEAMVARAREVEGVWDGDKMDQIKPKALNFFLCAATTISLSPTVSTRKVRRSTHAQRPASPASPTLLVSFDRQGAIGSQEKRKKSEDHNDGRSKQADAPEACALSCCQTLDDTITFYSPAAAVHLPSYGCAELDGAATR